MSKTRRLDPIKIKEEDLPVARKSWGKTKPFTRIEEDKKTRKNRRECREFKHREFNDE